MAVDPVVYLGDAQFPGHEIDLWLATVPSISIWQDWPSQWVFDQQHRRRYEPNVLELLELLAAEQLSEVEIANHYVRVRALVANDSESWLAFRGVIAAAFRIVGKLGGTGTFYAITASDAATDRGFAVEAAPDADRCIALPADDIAAVRDSVAGRELETVVRRATGHGIV